MVPTATTAALHIRWRVRGSETDEPSQLFCLAEEEAGGRLTGDKKIKTFHYWFMKAGGEGEFHLGKFMQGIRETALKFK